MQTRNSNQVDRVQLAKHSLHNSRLGVGGVYPCVLLGCLIVALCGCGGQSGVVLNSTPAVAGHTPIAAALDRSASAIDSDRDGVPDDIETALGTDPEMHDTDMDGLTDHYELWGWAGYPVGIVGDPSALADPNQDGVLAALDQGEMANQVLKNASELLAQERVPVTLPEEGVFLPNDMDGDGIPNDFELHGFYFTFDEYLEPYFVKWDSRVYDGMYFKTDPTKWSTDGDPYSDWEEATKINLDQRVKFPGDHPCIPAYPRMHLILDKYTITLNQDVVIESADGKATEESWTNTTNTVNTTEDLDTGHWQVGLYTDTKKGFKANNPLWSTDTGAIVNGGFSLTQTTVNETTVDNTTSGLTSEEWSTARAVSGNTLEAAFVNFNFHMVNTGTLPADNIVCVCNLRLGTKIICSFLAGNDENGELKGRSGNVRTLQVSTTGRPTLEDPTGKPLVLSLNQLRSLQCGAPLTVEVESFEGDTIVWDIDPDTGRRTFLTYGEWSPYESAIKNTSARLLMDFGDDPTYAVQLFNGLPIMRVEEVRVACFPTDGTYAGSPPRIDMYDAFFWAYDVRFTNFGPTVTIRDPISNWKHTSLIADWNFGFDQETIEDIIANPQDYDNLFLIPLEPGNPVDRYYICEAPPQGELAKPQIYWALCSPETRKIRSYSRDVRGIKEMRFKPDPDADYDGEAMSVGYDPDDPDMQFFYTYELPAQYKWTGFEQVVAINRDDKRTVMSIDIDGALGHPIEEGTLGTPAGEELEFAIDEDGKLTDIGAAESCDFTFAQEWNDDNDELVITLTPKKGKLHDAMIVIDPVDIEGNPLLDDYGKPIYTLDYNYLRKQVYGTNALVEQIDPGGLPGTPLSRTYCLLSQTGVLAVIHPVLYCPDPLTAPEVYQVGTIEWRTYEGI